MVLNSETAAPGEPIRQGQKIHQFIEQELGIEDEDIDIVITRHGDIDVQIDAYEMSPEEAAGRAEIVAERTLDRQRERHFDNNGYF